LVDKSSVKPQLILTDQPEILELRNHIDVPVVLVDPTGEERGERTMKLGRQTIRFHEAHQSDQVRVDAGAQQIPADADLREPFSRVREALQETLKTGALR
jgi:hypothetical protein